MSVLSVVSGKMNAAFAKPMRLVSAGLVAVMSLSLMTNGLSLMGIAMPNAFNTTTVAANGVAVRNGDVQIVRTELDYGAYPPITVLYGIPVEWTIHVEEKKLNGCNHAIVIPEYNLEVTLQPGDNLICFTPNETGIFSFTCWMGMIHSSITVTNE